MPREIPKYQAIHDILLKRLLEGYYSVGLRMPTEELLARSFSVSRVTIRKALGMLVRAGYLTARQGSGYEVATLSPPSATNMVSFTDQVLREGRVPGARLIRIECATEWVPEEVGARFDEPLTLVERVRTVDDAPRMLTQTWVPVRLAPNMRSEDFPQTGHGQSILRVLQQTFGIRWTSAREWLDSVLSQADVSRHLGIAARQPILSQQCTAFDQAGAPVFFGQVYRQGPIQYDITGGLPQRTSS